jgi:hypothetical protein
LCAFFARAGGQKENEQTEKKDSVTGVQPSSMRSTVSIMQVHSTWQR